MTPKQQQRIELLTRFAEVDISQFKEKAKVLGMPSRFIKALDEMKAYATLSCEELIRQTTTVEHPPHK